MPASLLTALLLAQAGPPATPPPAAVPPTAAPAEDLALTDVDDRMTVPVSIAGRGPFAFIIDTGAERTVVSHDLADRLALAAGPAVSLLTMAGSAPAATVTVPSLGVGSTTTGAITAPVLARQNIGALGILGLDVLQGKAVTIDFERQVMSVAPVRHRRSTAPAQPDEIVVVGRNLFGQLVVTDAYYRGHRIRVVLDTGSMATVGNAALHRLVLHSTARPVAMPLISVTGDVLNTTQLQASDLQIGGVGMRDIPIAFAEAAPFARFGLTNYPALLLGMDTLRLFRRVEIDFANRQARFLLPRRAPGEVGISTQASGRF